jgi:hypothetical protein
MYSNIVIDAIARERATATLDGTQRDAVIANLVFVYQVIIATESLLEEAIEASEHALRDYFVSHLEEERDHQAWLAEDLRSAGIDVAKMPLSQIAVEMAGSQYYLIKHVNPASLLGYMAVLEGFPIALEVVTELESQHGKDLFRTLRYHAEHDIDHSKELFAVINQCADPIILRSALQTATYMNKFTRELRQE